MFKIIYNYFKSLKNEYIRYSIIEKERDEIIMKEAPKTDTDIKNIIWQYSINKIYFYKGE